VVAGDDNFTIDKSVLSFYQKTGSKYLFKGLGGECTRGKKFIVPDSLKGYLCATPTMQVDHPDIKKLARQFAQINSVCERIKAMNDYVYTTLRKEYTAAFSSALETYKAGFGDCGEHAVLLAALLRASEIPARVVFGVIYMPSKKGYYYHAWVLAFDGSNWIFTDPAFGVFPANRDRVPLVIDDSGEKMISLARVIGRLKIDYITN
jgi:transglutaminase-like putative cysteine protease